MSGTFEVRSLSVIQGTAVTGKILVSSTALENEYAAYDPKKAYAVGDRCISTATHRVYEALVASTGKDPTAVAGTGGTTPPWLDTGATNRWAMFDDEANTQTVVASPLTLVLRPGPFNAFFLAGLDAEQIEYTVKDAPDGVVVAHYVGPLEASAPGDYDEYFYGRYKPMTDFIASDIPQNVNTEITITLSRASGEVRCGMLAIGDRRTLGQTQRGARVKPKSYSYIDTNEFGKTRIQRRKATTDMSATAILDVVDAATVQAILQEQLDVPSVWIGSDEPGYSGLRVFGLGSGEIEYDATECILNLNVLGLI
ncbi:hypothetical protein IP92_00509 [Pseudoduganella flava]|uniref:Uncharacterized protein n=1 Tax=Pseudoduganella flava TaxID=871742 RepID=A0A562Q463_9BURK|nr:hypothetical protein [Pseudoduganella flava]QGZ41547.1 hypothetical protein GO485_22480 [Pseudoduganella flava]TWI51522.1 hypothetical protein IP92_00509 [Pseudoduganella flava]